MSATGGSRTPHTAGPDKTWPDPEPAAIDRRDPHPRADREPRAAFDPDEVAAILGIKPALLRALIQLAADSRPVICTRPSCIPQEVSQLIGLEPETIAGLTATGKLRSAAVGGYMPISRDRLEAFLRGDIA